jgi:ADP-heptose:LPS heptosyltransferase
MSLRTERLESYAKSLPEMTGPYKARNRLLVGALKTFDLIGRFQRQRRGTLPTDRRIRVLVANWGHLGDVVTTLPLLEALKKDPRVEMVGVLVGSWSKAITSGVNAIDVIHTLDHWLMTRGGKGSVVDIVTYWRQKRAVIRDIMRERYDVSVDLFATFPSTHRVMWQAKIPVRVGFESSGFGSYLTRAHPWSVADEYILTKQIRLFEGLIDGLPSTPSPAYPDFSPERSAIERLGGATRFIIMHIGSGDKRGWTLDNWVSLGRILNANGWRIILTGTNGPEAKNAKIVSDQVNVQNLAGALRWNEFVTVISRAAAVICVDTVTGHLAACFQVPAIVLTTGRTKAQLWRPNGPNVRALMYPVGCAPCHRTLGCEAMACVRLITVDEVVSNLRELFALEQKPRLDILSLSGAASKVSDFNSNLG